MQEELERFRLVNLSLCDRLLAMLEENREEARLFFGGELYQAYDTVTDKAKNKIHVIRNKLRNL